MLDYYAYITRRGIEKVICEADTLDEVVDHLRDRLDCDEKDFEELKTSGSIQIGPSIITLVWPISH